MTGLEDFVLRSILPYPGPIDRVKTRRQPEDTVPPSMS